MRAKELLMFAVFVLSAAAVFGDVEKGLLQKDWFLGGIFGVVATLLGFALTIAWDQYKTRRDAKERERVVTRSIDEELAENTEVVKYDLDLIEQELLALSDRKNVVQPMRFLRTGFWEVAKINLGSDRLTKVRDLVSLAEVYEHIRSRENYRVNSQAMTNFFDRLRAYDDVLMQNLRSLGVALKDAATSEKGT